MPLTWRIRVSYAVGHILNDVCASVWFTYTLVYFKFGLNFPTALAGSIVLIGQLADGLATPLVGYFSDKDSVSSIPRAEEYSVIEDSPTTPFTRIRQPRCCSSWYPRGRKAWHFWGSLMVIFSFPLLYGSPIELANTSTWAKMLFYVPVTIIFQVGWACIQITHLAIMNDLTLDSGERTLLTSLRYLSTVLSNLTVYLATYFLLNASSHAHRPHHVNRLSRPVAHSGFVGLTNTGLANGTVTDGVDFGKDDLPMFRNLALIIVAIGSLTTLGFHIGIRRSDFLHEQSALIQTVSIESPSYPSQSLFISSYKDWLRLPLFWIHGFFYMSIRVIVNVSQAYITVYLLHSLALPKINMALVPLTIYLASILSLLVQKPIQDRISRELNVLSGFLFITCFCILVNYPGLPVQLARVYISGALLGIGCTIILVTGLAMISDLIGSNQDNGAFVYGYMSFVDKLANGVVIQVAESLWNKFPCPRYYQNIEAYGIGGWVVVAVIFLFLQSLLKWRTYSHYEPFRFS